MQEIQNRGTRSSSSEKNKQTAGHSPSLRYPPFEHESKPFLCIKPTKFALLLFLNDKQIAARWMGFLTSLVRALLTSHTCLITRSNNHDRRQLRTWVWGQSKLTSLSIISGVRRLMNTGFPRHLKITLVPETKQRRGEGGGGRSGRLWCLINQSTSRTKRCTK